MLSCYYLLVIRYSWPDSRLRKARIYFHIPPVLGVVAAFASIPYIGNGFAFCFVLAPPAAASYWPITFIEVIPVLTCLLVATVNTLLVYAAVRRQERKMRKWRFPSTDNSTTRSKSGLVTEGKSVDGKQEDKSLQRDPVNRSFRTIKRMSASIQSNSQANNKLQRAAFWQGLFYLGAFYLSWTCMIVINVAFANERVLLVPYWCWAFYTFTIPLQGFLNFFVYIRPTVISKWQRKVAARKTRAHLTARREREQVERCPSGPAPVGKPIEENVGRSDSNERISLEKGEHLLDSDVRPDEY